MTRLEEEIESAINKFDRITPRPITSADQARIAAEVAKKYIEKALTDFEGCGCCQPYPGGSNEWLKENGIVE